MTTPLPIRALVDPPRRELARYGLLSAAHVIDGPNPHQYNGVEYDYTCTNMVQPYRMPQEAGCDDDGRWITPDKVASPGPDLIQASPFALYTAWSCGLEIDWSETERRLRDRLDFGEEHRVEQVIETGSLGNRPALTQNTAVLDTTGDLSVKDAEAVLAHWIDATFGSLGVVHVPRYAYARIEGLLQHPADGGHWYEDSLGNRIALGSGYVGSAPAGHEDDGALWLYGTGPVTVRRSAVIQPASVDSPAGSSTLRLHAGQNDPGRPAYDNFMLVERIYVVDWPCQAAAVKTSMRRPVVEPEQDDELRAEWHPVPDDPMAIDLTVSRQE